MIAFFRALTASRVLDDRRSGRAPKDQALIHALLSAREQAPIESVDPFLRRKIFTRVEATAPVPAPRLWDRPVGRLAMVAPVLLAAGLSAFVFVRSNAQNTPTTLPPIVQARGPVPSPIYAVSMTQGEKPGVEPVRAGAWYSPLPPRGPARPMEWQGEAGLWNKFQGPILAEAHAFKQDTRLMAQALLSKLPLRHERPEE